MQSSLAARDGERAAELMWARAAAAPATGEALRASYMRGEMLFALGRPAAARHAFLATPVDSLLDRQIVVLMSIASGADTAAAAAAARTLAANADAPPAPDASSRMWQILNACHAELWRLSRGDARTAEATIARLRSASPPTIPPGAVAGMRRCALLLEAQLAVVQHSPAATRTLERLDSSLTTHAYGGWTEPVANLLLARAWEARGDRTRALRAVRRREWGIVFMAAPELREEARLCALLGDRECAIRAYRSYLELRFDPEPELRPEVAHARAQFARLVGQRAPSNR
jgi:hypothetical protein